MAKLLNHNIDGKVFQSIHSIYSISKSYVKSSLQVILKFDKVKIYH